MTNSASDEYLKEIQNGTFYKRFPCFDIVDKDQFLSLLDSLPESMWTVEHKWDGWFTILCEKGLFSKTGQLLRDDWVSSRGKFYCGEYLIGTQWALKSTHKDKFVIHWSNEPYDSYFSSDVGFWVPRYTFDYVRKNLNRLLGGWEGLILKNTETGEFFRWKQEFTEDYVILGFNQSDSKSYKGKAIKSIVVGLYVDNKLQPIGDIGLGLDLKQRMDMYNNPKKYVGYVIECSGKGLFRSGMLRHATFKRIREDKKPTDCIYKGVQ